MMKKTKNYRYSRGVSAEFEAWHKALIEHAHAVVKAASPDERLDQATKNVIQRRVIKLEALISFFYRDEGYPYQMAPFAVDDAAALILWKRPAAVRLARRLLPKIPKDMVEEWLQTINMDWFSYELGP